MASKTSVVEIHYYLQQICPFCSQWAWMIIFSSDWFLYPTTIGNFFLDSSLNNQKPLFPLQPPPPFLNATASYFSILISPPSSFRGWVGQGVLSFKHNPQMIWITTGILLCKWRNPAFPEETARLSVTSLLLGVIECVFQTTDFSASFTGLYFFESKINCGISVSLELLQFSETSSRQFCWCLLTHFVTPHLNLRSLLVWIIGSGASTIFLFCHYGQNWCAKWIDVWGNGL